MEKIYGIAIGNACGTVCDFLQKVIISQNVSNRREMRFINIARSQKAVPIEGTCAVSIAVIAQKIAVVLR